jgi:N-acetylneuraminate synthase
VSSVYIIAEAGVNHNGDPKMAFQLIDAAVESGVDAVKFQTFKAERIVTKNAIKADYQNKTTDVNESQFSMLKRLELTHELHYELITYCKKKGVEFLSTAFDLESLHFLVNDLKLKTLKISSGDITNAPLLLAHAQTNCDLILSTGMSTLEEIEEALGVLAFGLLSTDDSIKPSIVDFQKAFSSIEGQQLLNKRVTILHCTTEYPAPPEELNLNAMATMRNFFRLKTGYSDHSDGITASIIAVTLGAVLIEKHFTLDKCLEGPDHKASLNPNELINMVEAIRMTEKAIGSGIKEPMPSELKNISIARKSIIAAKNIKKGEVFTNDNLTIKRPGTGISPMKFWELIGKESKVNFAQDMLIEI